ncbi:bromodomain adjacent to zinc finger domain protein 2B-like isoform X2 [Dendronephthya gigantea]|uniref:bromodomain adjacent to zinc finger domain protein 2B-like isoform X2 n=1 Tax=Dendronephthya gigantea TaxID=151771 RepID=UPI00106AB002|nr:bromodomain adjacent to zinc finger domain protein 2B-like isoform X2 [Dendronephthya gigantea]
MEPNDVPSQSPIHSSRTFFDSTMIGQPPILQSPPLPHEHRYGLAQMPSAFSVIGRRPSFPSVNSHHHDFTPSLTHDPLMATSPRIQRSPTPATSSSWWRQPSITAHPQNMNNTDIFGNPLLWLPHEQEHMRSHENLTYHNPTQAYRNFDFLNGSSPGSYYASTPRFFPEPAHSLHSMPTLGKDRPLAWEDRLGGHSLMLDVSGNGFSPWQDIHQQKMVDRQKQMQEVEEKRNTMGLSSNRPTNFSESNSAKSLKQNHNTGPPANSNASRLKVQPVPSESCLNVPVISNETRHNIPGIPNNSRLNLLGMPNDSRLKVPGITNEHHLRIPSISSETGFNIPSLSSEPKLDIPPIANESQLNDTPLSDDLRHGVTSSSGDSRHGITSITGDSRFDVPSTLITESRLNTPPLMPKEPQQNLPPMASESQQNAPNHQLKPLEKPNYSHADTSMPITNIGRAQADKNVQQVSSRLRERAISPPKPDIPVNLEQYKRDAPVTNHDQYKRDSVINTLESNTTSTAPIFSPPALIKSSPAPIAKPSQPSSALPSPNKLPPARPTGGKPPLLERFRATAIPRPDGDSSSDDGSSDGDEEDGESGSDSDSDDDGISEDGNFDYEDDVKGKKPLIVKPHAQPLQPQQLKPKQQQQHVIQQEPEVSSESEIESGSGGSESSDDDDEEDDDQDGDAESNDGNQDSDFSQDQTSPGKRKSTTDSGPPRKRRVVVVDEELMKIPLEKGWRRQTKLRPAAGSGGLRGDVYYFAPCGKKIRTYPDVKKYIEKNGITDMDLAHFSFSMKLHLGEFLECTQGNEFRVLTEEEIHERKRSEKQKQEEKQARLNKKKEKKKEQQENAKKVAEAKMHRRLERQAAVEAAKQVKLRKAQERLQQKLEKQEMLQAAKQAKKERARLLAEQKRKSKEEQKLQKIEKQKLEKEVKAQQLIEARKKKKEDVANAKYHEAMRKAKERELKRQQVVLLKAQEKERLKEEKRRAKKLVKERKLEQKRREMILSRELKKPVEDMVLRDAKPLPELTRVKDLKISGNAFADLCMVQEFLHNFGTALDIDFENEVPSMADMQASLLNENDEDVITPLCQTMLLAALDDPGVEGPCAETALGVKLDQVEVNEHNVSEVLRLFILARNAEPNEISDSLTEKPFTALSPSQKAGSLAFICNELLCGRTICREIENKIEFMSSLRHNKWIAEGNLRKLKSLQQQKFPDSKIPKPVASEEKKSPGKKAGGSTTTVTTPNEKERKRKAVEEEDGSEGSDDDEDDDEEDDDEIEEDEEEEDDDAGEDDEGGDDEEDESDNDSADEEKAEPETLDEFERRIKRLEKKQAQFRSKLFISSHSLRALYLGQDRFRRMYWVLPYGGSLYIEGNDNGETGLEHFDLSKISDEHSVMGGKNYGGQRVFSPGLSRCIDEMKGTTGESQGHYRGFHGNLMTGTRDEHSPMKLLMQHVSLQGKQSGECSSNGLKSPTQDNRNHLAQFPDHSTSIASESTNSSTSSRGAKVILEGATGPWFDLLPREPCDKTTITNCWMPTINTQRIPLDGSAPRRPGRPPKQPKISEGESSSGVVEAAEKKVAITPPPVYQLPSAQRPLTLDEVRRSVMESLRQDPAPIPKEMQCGWWRVMDQRLLKDLTKTLHQRGIREKSLQKNILKFNDYTHHSFEKQEFQLSTEVNSSDEEDEPVKPEGDESDKEIVDTWFPDQAFAANKNILIEVEELEEKIFAASLQIKGWRLPAKASQTLSYSRKSDGSKPESLCGLPLTIAITRLAALEAGIERRYLKSPLRNDKLQIPANLTNGSSSKNEEQSAETSAQVQGGSSEKEEVITPALKLWRETVSACRTPAQLYMCLTLLADCIAWAKSIMKVFCQMCRKGDNEELLLLCDGCDRGYHTYCCQPKLDTIPQGDWYCTDCIIMATGKSCCFMCRGTQDRLLRCTQCPRNYHPQCVDPPLAKIPRCWSCPNCKKVKSKSRSRASTTSRKRKKQIQAESEALDEKNSLTEESRQHLNRKQCSKDMAPCRSLLAEMEKHEDAWPFLVPVNPKQFPEYYTIILSPMDFHTMKVKLRDFQYTSREEFAADSRLVFDNCNHYNEDDSEVGQAGKRLRKFFEKRWQEICQDCE